MCVGLLSCINIFSWLCACVWRCEGFQTQAFREENTLNMGEKHWRRFSARAAADRVVENIPAKTQNMTTMWHIRCKIEIFQRYRTVVLHKCCVFTPLPFIFSFFYYIFTEEDETLTQVLTKHYKYIFKKNFFGKIVSWSSLHTLVFGICCSFPPNVKKCQQWGPVFASVCLWSCDRTESSIAVTKWTVVVLFPRSTMHRDLSLKNFYKWVWQTMTWLSCAEPLSRWNNKT